MSSEKKMMVLWLWCTYGFTHLVAAFVSEKKPGWRNTLSLGLACLALGLLLGTILFLGMFFSIASSATVSLSTPVSIGAVVSVPLFFSKHLRCFSILLLLSCGMREGRNVFITVGTGVVIFHNIKNIFLNLEGLANSIACSLEAKRLSILLAPLDNYINAIRWIYNEGKLFSNPLKDVVTVEDHFHVKGHVLDEHLKLKIQETELHIRRVSENISTVLNSVSNLGKGFLFAISIAMVAIGTGMFHRRYLMAEHKIFQKTYITKGFTKLDDSNRKQMKPCVLPLNKRERMEYAMIPSLSLKAEEWKAVGIFLLPAFTNIGIWAILTAIDVLLYWLIFSIQAHLQELLPMKVPFSLSNVKGVYADPNVGYYNTYEDYFQIHLFELKCIPLPTLSLSKTWIPLSAIIVVLLILGLLSATLTQLKVLVLASFYPDKESERLAYLHAKLLKRRRMPLSRNAKTEIRTLANTLHFWFPILKMKGLMTRQKATVPERSTV
ncbi:dendritic cell-specific transmembrane protein [Ambystoma mexicanum]|uniref:dendritic cell-specific transmembrane protein n=1 Tax=Ambystoma mexicanum TaxID=8296 RepID=UPI0037E8E0C6